MALVRTIRGDTISIDIVCSSQAVSRIRESISSKLGVRADELLLVRDNNDVLSDGDILGNDKTQNIRVVHRPVKPTFLNLSYFGLLLFFLSQTYALAFDVSVMGWLYTVSLSLLIRYLPRRYWLLPVSSSQPVVDTFNDTTDAELKRHLLMIPIYNESPKYLEPMMTALLNAEKTWPITVLFAAEMNMDEQWIELAKERLEKNGFTVVTVRHPRNLLNEIPQISSNVNWALESFCFRAYEHLANNNNSSKTNDNNESDKDLFINPNKYLMTKCDSNGVLDKGYLLEIERVSKSFQLNTTQRLRFFIQPPWRWIYTNGWGFLDSKTKSLISAMWDMGEGGMSHFSFPLSQFIEIGKYSHSNFQVLDDINTYIQQEKIGVQFVMTDSTIYKYHDNQSDLLGRMLDKWLWHLIGNCVVEGFSVRRMMLFPYHFGAKVIYQFIDPLAFFVKGLRIYYLCLTTNVTPMYILSNTSNYFGTTNILFIIFIHALSAIIVRFRTNFLSYRVNISKVK